MIGTKPAWRVSRALVRYSLLDPNPGTGDIYYRLRMVDRDGSYAFSQIRNLNFGNRTGPTIYPNPVSNMLSLANTNIGVIAKIELINASGRVVDTKEVPIPDKINIENLPAGTYIIKVTFADGQTSTHRLVIAR